MFHKDLWDQSGHLANYAEDMYGLQEGLSAGIVMEDEEEVSTVTEKLSNNTGLKPMNCPAHCICWCSQSLLPGNASTPR